MKRLIICLLAALAITSASSCKKDWTCSCYTQDVSTGNDQYYSATISNETKTVAQTRCEDAARAGTFGTAITTCSISE